MVHDHPRDSCGPSVVIHINAAFGCLISGLDGGSGNDGLLYFELVFMPWLEW